MNAWVISLSRCFGLLVLRVISCFETVTQHMSDQPFCILSMEAFDMVVTHAKNVVCCRFATSGAVTQVV